MCYVCGGASCTWRIVADAVFLELNWKQHVHDVTPDSLEAQEDRLDAFAVTA